MNRREPGQKRMPLSESAVRFLILVLAEAGFYYSMLSLYGLQQEGRGTILFALCCCVVFHLVFSLKYSLVLFGLSVVIAGVLVFTLRDRMAQSWLVLIREAVTAFGRSFPEALEKLIAARNPGTGYAVCSILFVSTALTAYSVNRTRSTLLLTLASVPVLIPALFFGQTCNTYAAFVLFAAWFSFALMNRFAADDPAGKADGEGIWMRVKNPRPASFAGMRNLSAIGALVLFAAAFLIGRIIIPEKGYAQPELWSKIKDGLYESELGSWIGKPNDGLNHGRFTEADKIRFTGETAFYARVSEHLSLYLRSFTGTDYTYEGWEPASEERYEKAGVRTNPLLFHAEIRERFSSEKRYELSVRSAKKPFESLLLPPGLLTGASGAEGTAYFNDSGIVAKDSGGMKAYSVSAMSIYPALYSISVPAEGTQAERIRSGYMTACRSQYGETQAAEDIERYLAYVFDAYTSLPDDTRENAAGLCGQFGIAADLSGNKLNLSRICYDLQKMFNTYCRYSYDPPAVPEGEDFSVFFMNESRQGYCIHFATVAAVMLRSMGIPARYAEGYIIVQSDYLKGTDAEGYIRIEDTHAHAWVEVFDPVQLEWIPVEMTPSAEDNDRQDAPLPTPAATLPPPSDLEQTEPPDDDSEETPEEPETDQDNELPEEPDEEPGTEDQTDNQETGAETPEPDALPDGEGQNGTDAPDGGSLPEEGGPSGSQNGAGTAAAGKRKALLPVLIVIMIPAASALAYFLNRNRRRAAMNDSDRNKAVRYLARDCFRMIRLAGGSGIPKEIASEADADAAAAALSWLDADGIRLICRSAEEAAFSGRTVSAEQLRTLRGIHHSIRNGVMKHGDLLQKLAVFCRYSV